MNITRYAIAAAVYSVLVLSAVVGNSLVLASF